MLLQLLLGGTAGVAMIAKMYWSRIKQFFGRGSSAISTPKTDKTEK